MIKRKVVRPSILLVVVAIVLFYEAYDTKEIGMVIVGVILIVFAITRLLLVKYAGKNLVDSEEVYEDTLTKFLKRDEIRHLEMLTAYKHGDIKILYEELDGVMFYDEDNKTYYATATTVEAVQDMMALLPPDYDTFVAHSQLFLGIFEARMKVKRSLISYNYWYKSKERIPLPEVDMNVETKMLDESYIPVVMEHYKLQKFCNKKYLTGRMEQGMMGAFVDGKLVGFIGVHDTGAIGMLEIFEEYRGKHIAEYLEASFINKLLDDNYEDYIFSQVNSKNEVSTHIQSKLHFKKAEHPNVWYFS